MKIEKEDFIVEDMNDSLVEKYGMITCGCDNPELKVTAHLDFKDKAVTNYVCKCGNVIIATFIREME